MAADDLIGTALNVLDEESLAQIRARAARLVNRMLTEAERQIETATPEIRAQMVRSALPAILKELSTGETGDDLSEMRREQTELMEGIRVALTSRVIEVDAAPAGDAVEGDA